MWNSNSLISWLLVGSGHAVGTVVHLSAAVHLDGLPGSLLRAGIPSEAR